MVKVKGNVGEFFLDDTLFSSSCEGIIKLQITFLHSKCKFQLVIMNFWSKLVKLPPIEDHKSIASSAPWCL